MSETSSIHTLPIRYADFPSLAAALDYAAQGSTGMNFYDRRNQLVIALEYRELRQRARRAARRLLSINLPRGTRVALFAETRAEFVDIFFACQYAGLVAVPLAIPLGVGQSASCISKLERLLSSCQPAVIIAGSEWLPLIHAAKIPPGLRILSHDDLNALPENEVTLWAPAPDDIAYLQYTSGSTRFPRGVIVTQRAVMANLRAIGQDGIKAHAGDRCVSWLPFYHDMGLVGFMLTPMATQLSVDYLRTQDFAMRPLLWLKLITRNAATISVAPPFGYEICLRRCSEKELAELDLSRWRVAGVGAEPVPSDLLTRFYHRFSQVGFARDAFMPCYGLAENTLAVSFFDRATGPQSHVVDRHILEHEGRAVEPADPARARSTFVNCGKALPGHRIEIRNDRQQRLPERQVGHICIAGPSLMSGYYGDAASQQQIRANGWMDTGDLGYLLQGNLYITGRKKDLIIIRGRNIWPQDIEGVAESEPEFRSGDAIAFVTTPGGEDAARIILQIQCRISSAERRSQIVHSLSSRIQSEFGVAVDIMLVPPHSIPKTSSGKPSRAEAKKRYLTGSGAPTPRLTGHAQ
ncbi:fatty acyl-AMP ligase [Erwinia sp. E602]|uniref:fatty acyl-AMP ligase n=1 Tax=Erwinia sp. E602 TaxID=2675378 RepID=UPI001BA5E34A|nr:fatty acyl-AMP ligase [Erwinia sp. E602]QUG74688.1 fatty acyl-AMP ligase [Erwinia sp. E602]